MNSQPITLLVQAYKYNHKGDMSEKGLYALLSCDPLFFQNAYKSLKSKQYSFHQLTLRSEAKSVTWAWLKPGALTAIPEVDTQQLEAGDFVRVTPHCVELTTLMNKCSLVGNSSIVMEGVGIHWERQFPFSPTGDYKYSDTYRTEVMSWEVVKRYAEMITPEAAYFAPYRIKPSPRRLAQVLAHHHTGNSLRKFCKWLSEAAGTSPSDAKHDRLWRRAERASFPALVAVMMSFEAKGWIDERGELTPEGEQALGPERTP